MSGALDPRVIILDLDGTVIGRIGAPACEHHLLQMLAPNTRVAGTNTNTRAGTGMGGAAGAPMRAFRDGLIARLRYGIIRPHMHAFCAQAAQQGVELFVYTASEASWAAFLVPCIEAALGLKFNRPILTRAHCIKARDPATGVVQYRKSLTKVLPLVHAGLARAGQRGGGKTNAAPNASRTRRSPLDARGLDALRARTIMVDNTPDIMLEARDAARVVECPTYNYSYTYDVLERIGIDVRHHKFGRIMAALAQSGMFPQHLSPSQLPTTYQQFAAVYYRSLAAVLGAALDANAAALGDRFWLRMQHALEALRDGAFDDAAVRSLRSCRTRVAAMGGGGGRPHTAPPRSTDARLRDTHKDPRRHGQGRCPP